MPHILSCWNKQYNQDSFHSILLPRSTLYIDRQKALCIQAYTGYVMLLCIRHTKLSSLGKRKWQMITITAIEGSDLCPVTAMMNMLRNMWKISNTQFICEHTEIHTFNRWSRCIQVQWPLIQEGRLLLCLSAGFIYHLCFSNFRETGNLMLLGVL